MCGIAGLWDFAGTIDILPVIRGMASSMVHRGPDDGGSYTDPDERLALGHRRLSILDLSSAGHQPMGTDDGEYWIVLNGEVYNFAEIGKDLEGAGASFRSRSDTEVVLKAYARYGPECLDRLIGMFAFAVWERRRRRLFLARDRLGVKPLYWSASPDRFVFASELKAFHRVPGFRVALDPAALPAYLQFGYVPAPGTIFEGVRKLRPGHWLEIGKDGAVREEPYWDLESRILARRATWAGGRAPGEEALVEELEALLVDAFRYRLVSDVPVGIMLSGGIDSSTVAAILRRKVGADLKTFTVAFDEKAYDESPAARAVAEHLGADHHQLSCSSREALEVIPKLPEIYDEPFGDNSAVPTYLLSRLTRQHVTVALSADGGDEIFCGYAHYPAVSRFARILRWLPRPAVPLVRGALGLISPDALEAVLGRFPRLTNGARVRARYSKLRRALGADGPDRIFEISRSCWFPDEVDRLLGRSPGAGESHLLRILKTIDGDPMQRMMVADSRTYLPDDILVKVDRATMAVSLEAREPFLDHRLVEFAMSLPIGFRYRKGRTKYILRKVLSRHVPAGLVDRPKHGFSMPVWDWFRKDLTNLYREYLGPARLARSGIFDVREVDRELTSYLEGRSIRGEHLWLILVFEMWRERWLGAH